MKIHPIFYRYLPLGNGVRQFINPDIGIKEFFKTLNKRDASYIILRWFEDLPSWPENEDIDILIDDNDLGKIKNLLVKYPQNIPIDLYTVTARNGWNGMPCYPPHLARKMLENKVLWKDYYIPCLKDYFLSLCYHIVYHKAEKSGLPISEKNDIQTVTSEHPYSKMITSLGEKAGFTCRPFLNDIHHLLQNTGWTPSIDTFRKLAEKSPWLTSMLPRIEENQDKGELLVFVIREGVFTYGMWDYVLDLFKNHDYEIDILHTIILNQEQKEMASRSIRGGEWGRGPFPKSGGKPGAIIIAFDYHPAPVGQKRKKTHPYIKNEHIFLKEIIRDEINRGIPRTEWMNSIHSSDDEIEAWEYLNSIFDKDFIYKLKAEIKKIRGLYRTDHKVISLVESIRTRGKVEIIEYCGSLAVKKTFKKGRERFCERERYAYEHLSKKQPAIPPLLSGGKNYVIIPYYENILKNLSAKEKKHILHNYSRQIIDFMFFMYLEGYALIDFWSGSILITPENKFKVIDFEFLYKYKQKPENFYQSFEIAGVPADFKGDVPRGHKPFRTYKWRWKGIIRENIKNL